MLKLPDLSQEFAQKRVLVTGGTKGTGKAVVERMLAAGATLITAARGDKPDDIASECYVQADLATTGGVEKLATAVHDRMGGVDILIHVLGGSSNPSGGFAVIDDAGWEKELNLNLMAAVRLDRCFVPEMIMHGNGVVVHTSSIQRRLPLFDATTAYAAAKAALTTYRAGSIPMHPRQWWRALLKGTGLVKKTHDKVFLMLWGVFHLVAQHSLKRWQS